MSDQKRWKISFSPKGDGRYDVEVRRSEGMVPDRFTAKIPPDIDDLISPESSEGEPALRFHKDAASFSPEARLFSAKELPSLKAVGERILNSMLDVGNGVVGYEVLGVLKNEIAENEGLELQIDLSQAPELSSVPWESLYLRSTDSFLSVSKTSNIVRRMDAQRHVPEPIERPIRLLVVSANPHEDLDTSVEIGNIEKRIENMIAAGKDDFQIRVLARATRNALREAIGEFHPHIIHYIGHSHFDGEEGYLKFECGTPGEYDAVTADELRFMLANDRPWLVVLNSCKSGTTSHDRPMAGVAQSLLGRLNIPFVVAMQQPISDDAAILFSQTLYAELTAGQTVANAVTAGRAALFTDADHRTKLEIITPALYTSGAAERLHFTASEVATAVSVQPSATPLPTAAAPAVEAAVPPPPPPSPPTTEPVTRGVAPDAAPPKRDWVKAAGLVAMGIIAGVAILIYLLEMSDEHDGDDLDELDTSATITGRLVNPVGAYALSESGEVGAYVYATDDGTEYIGNDVDEGTWEISEGAACFEFTSPRWNNCYLLDATVDGGNYFLSTLGEGDITGLSPTPAELKSAPYPGAYILNMGNNEYRLLLLSNEEAIDGRRIAFVGKELTIASWELVDGERCTTYSDSDSVETVCDKVSATSTDEDFTLESDLAPDARYVRLMN